MKKILKIARVQNDINQSELAEMLGVSLTTISAWETGKYKPSIDNLKKIAEVLDIDIMDLI